MKPNPAHEVIDQSAGVGGLVHISAFLAQALMQVTGVPAPAPRAVGLSPVVVHGPRRADIAKCSGDDLTCCSNCMRRLAVDAGPDQQWTAPAVTGVACMLYASQERFGALYGPAA